MPDPARADELVTAIRTGDAPSVARLIAADASLATDPLGGRHKTRTALHVVADWPGFWPAGPEIVRLLVAAGADPNAAEPTPGAETPLHWAASSDDEEVTRALIDAGADLDAPPGSIGTPVENAVGYGCWNVARLLVARGARVDKLWVAAALGLTDHLDSLLATGPDRDAISHAFWHACNGGQRRAAERLLTMGADVDHVPPHGRGTPLDATAQLGTQRQNLMTWLRDRGAHHAPVDPR